MSDIQTRDFSPEMSSDEICFGEDVLTCLTDVVNGKADIDHTHSEYALTNHSHTGYVSTDDLTLLEDVVNTKANAAHTHSEYASASHTHSDYATVIALDTLSEEVDGKANASHTHIDYASSTHTHDEYAPTSHSHSEYASTSHTHDNYASSAHTHSEYSVVGHDHDEDYASIDHAHSDYATTTALDEVSAVVSGKANTSHSHDDTYYTETEVDTKLAGKADTSHTHTGVYDANGAAASALTSANAYTDSKIDALVGEGASTTLDTIGEISSAIEDNQDAIDLLNSAIANKANVAHTHAVSDVIDLQEALDAKASNSHTHTASDIGAAASSHSHNDIYYTETEIDTLLAAKSNSSHTHDYVPTSRTINGKALSANITLSASDVGALSSDTDIPSALSDLTADSTHRLVTDAEKDIWNAKSNFSGNYNDLTNKPTIPSISGLATETYVDEAVSVKADSSHTHDTSYDALGTAEEKANIVQANLNTVSNELTSHINNDDIHFTAAERTKLSGISANANNYSHPNSGVTAGTYKSVTVNVQGHVTGGTNPTTLAGYGITDAESKGAANTALASAKKYTDDAIVDEVTARDSAIATAKSSAISTASSDATTKANNALASAKTYADSVGEAIKNDLLGNAGTAYDTLKELGDLIDDNTDAIEALEAVAAGKANASHTHTIANVTGLQSALDGKAASSHGTHVSYSTTVPVMNGTASVGTAATVARSDHKHPIDTSRASKTEFDTHASDATKHITSTERTNWGTAYTHSQSAHAPSNAEKNQNAFSYVKVGTTSVAADTATDTLTLVAGTNVTITPDATGDSITISATDTNTTYSAGTGISLSGTTFNNSGVRSVATGSSNGTISVNTNGTTANVAVKGLGSAAYTASTAYDAAGTAQTKADAALVSAKAYADGIKDDLLNGAGTAYDTLKELGDLIDANVDAIDALEIVAASKANASDLTAHTSNKSNPHGVTLAQLGLTATAAELNKMDGITATTAELNILDGVTATTAELNYVDGVTSNIQTQLNGKASASHTHNYAGSSSAGGAATSANKLNTNAGSATQPVYFANGIPVACTYTLGKSVPSNAVFTDTTYSVATASANGLMSASDKSKLDAMVIATVSEVETYLGI